MKYVSSHGIVQEDKNKLLMAVMAIGFALMTAIGLFMPANAEVNAVTPSTNDINRDNGWAHVNQLSQSIGETELEFVSTRGFASCFEYRTDGDTSQQTSPNNFNTDVTDGFYPL